MATPRGKGINALLASAQSRDVFWVEADKPVTGYARTKRRIAQDGFWAIHKQTGQMIQMHRVTVLEVLPE